MSSKALHTDLYELTMLDAWVKDGSVNKRAVFEVFTRKLPKERRYGVFAGLGRLLPMIEEFTFSPAYLSWLSQNVSLSSETLKYLGDFRFSGTITAYREGEIFFPNSPVLTVEGTLGECAVLETLILSVLNFDSAIATTAARMVSSANGRPIIEMGSRRVNEKAAVAAARAAYIAGFAATSNMQAAMEYGIPVRGTAAHAFTLSHNTEREAFESQIKAQGIGTTLLIDTYDTEQGIRNAVDAVTEFTEHIGGPGAVRIDSGDLFSEAEKARALLDELGATDTKITVTSDLDEHVIRDLQHAPIDGYGVGTKLVSSAPMGFVYKLVAIEGQLEGTEPLRPVAKKSADKASVGGKKTAVRLLVDGVIAAEVFSVDSDEALDLDCADSLQVVVMRDGEKIWPSPTAAARDYHALAKTLLPEGEQKTWSGEFGPFLTARPLRRREG